MKHFIHRHWNEIKTKSFNNKKGYNPEWIQEKFYNIMHVLIHISIIKEAIVNVRYIIKKHKEK